MRTTVDIDSHLLEQLREQAHREGVSFKELLNRTLLRGLAAEDPGSGASYECPTYHMGSPRHPMDKALRVADALHDEEVARKLSLRK